MEIDEARARVDQLMSQRSDQSMKSDKSDKSVILKFEVTVSIPQSMLYLEELELDDPSQWWVPLIGVDSATLIGVNGMTLEEYRTKEAHVQESN